MRGQLRLKVSDSTHPVAVGDQVIFTIENDGQGVVTDVLPRKNYIIRKSVKLSKQSQILAANIDCLWLVVTPVLPKTSTGFIDRVIAAAESFRIPVALIFTKCDLFKDDLKPVQDEYIAIYEQLNYPCYKVSSLNGEGLELIKMKINNGIHLFTGHSGVGKSSLINALAPGITLKVGKLSKQHLKGIHTTTFAQMIRQEEGGYIIDTPGIKEFVNIDFNSAEIGHYFIEMRNLFQQCRYNNCLHVTEDGCAVKQAVEEGKIQASRYYNYLSMVRNEDNFR